MHNRQALKHWRRHGDIKLEHRDDTGRMVAQFLINGLGLNRYAVGGGAAVVSA
jgi:hypothetical protein